MVTPGSKIPNITRIVLNPALSEPQRMLLVQYQRRSQTLTADEWAAALVAFDVLGGSWLEVEDQHYTFREFHETFVVGPYAMPLLDSLLAAEDVETVGRQRTGELWQTILSGLQAATTTLSDPHGVRALVMYCNYWWFRFSKGYQREIIVIRDMEQSQVDFQAHDLRTSEGLRSWYDLTVSGWFGDVKSSLYFLHVARNFPLRHDFYLTRLYDAGARQWLDVALLKPHVWQVLNGPAWPYLLDEAARHLPGPLRLTMRGENLVMVTYSDWKARVRAWQARQTGED